MSKEPRELYILQEPNSNRALLFERGSTQGIDMPLFREVTDSSEIEELRKDYAELLEVKERLAIRLHSEISTLTTKVKRYEEALNECHKIAIIGTNSASIKVTQIICKALKQGDK
jgi:hypothetical protein